MYAIIVEWWTIDGHSVPAIAVDKYSHSTFYMFAIRIKRCHVWVRMTSLDFNRFKAAVGCSLCLANTQTEN